MAKLFKKISPSQIIIFGFAAAILVGSLLLCLPFASSSGEPTPYSDALFTATSAVCVTGLIVRDTATYWSLFGQFIILLLIQIGGMGIVTVSVAIAMASGKKIGLKERSIMQESISAHKVGGIIRLTGFIIRATAIFELTGAALMAPVFCRDFGFLRGVWYALFHSVSAFCNAGFDLMGIRTNFSSFTHYVCNPLINIVLILLILIGGIGFLTWEDFYKNKLKFSRFRMQSKVILVASVFLVLVPAAYLFFFEITEAPLGERILASLFQSVTLRTAGFNTVDLSAMSEVGIAVMILIMMVGGAPGSTAGGMKITTLSVLISNALSVFTRREHAHFFGRRVSDETIKTASTILVMYLTLCLGGGFIISRIEELPLLTCLFETGSAIATVGLTLGITPSLGIISRLVLVFLMYCGRVGGLTLIFSALSDTRGNTARLPQENLTVG